MHIIGFITRMQFHNDTYTAGTAISISTDTAKSTIVVHTFFSSSVTGATIGFTLIYVNRANRSGPVRKASTGTIVIITIYGVCSITWTRLIAANSKMCAVTANWINGMKIQCISCFSHIKACVQDSSTIVGLCSSLVLNRELQLHPFKYYINSIIYQILK